MFKGWHGLFSNPSSETASTIVSDLKDGMYLEDYVAKHYKDLDPYSDREKDYIKELISKGDKNAKTYAGIKSDNKEDKKYTKEMNILKQEAENRGLNLNKRLSIKDYFNLLTD